MRRSYSNCLHDFLTGESNSKTKRADSMLERKFLGSNMLVRLPVKFSYYYLDQSLVGITFTPVARAIIYIVKCYIKIQVW